MSSEPLETLPESWNWELSSLAAQAFGSSCMGAAFGGAMAIVHWSIAALGDLSTHKEEADHFSKQSVSQKLLDHSRRHGFPHDSSW